MYWQVQHHQSLQESRRRGNRQSCQILKRWLRSCFRQMTTGSSRWKTCQAQENHSVLNTMSLIHQVGDTCALGESNLHAIPITWKDFLKTLFITKTTNNALTNTTMSFDFTFEPSNNYTDLSETTLYLKFTIEKPDGTALLVAVEAASVNNLLHSIFANVQLLINGEKVTRNYEQYPNKAYLTDLIATEYRDTVTRMEGCQKWIPDTTVQMDFRAATNEGWIINVS